MPLLGRRAQGNCGYVLVPSSERPELRFAPAAPPSAPAQEVRAAPRREGDPQGPPVPSQTGAGPSGTPVPSRSLSARSEGGIASCCLPCRGRTTTVWKWP